MDINTWINNPRRSYQDGLRIWRALRTDSTRDGFFLSVQDSLPGELHHNLLFLAVKNLYRVARSRSIDADVVASDVLKPIEPTPLNVKPAPVKALFVNNDIIDIKTLPPQLQHLYHENQRLTRELSGLHQQLKSALPDEKRQQVAAKISDLFAWRRRNWEQLDLYASTGQLPDGVLPGEEEKEKHSPQEVIQLKRRMDTLKINISRVKKELSKPATLSASKIASRNKRIAQWEQELSGIQQSLFDK